MPRKTSQAAKKDSESKSESGTTRRSGRAVAKQDSTPTKDASRSRRSSTAAQTAASVADSKTPKGRSGSRRDSTSPSDGRQRSRRESVESPATRVKSTRRSTSRVNYKESDGEEEATAPKYEETFDSNAEVDESDSDEKSKPKGRRAAKTPAKGRGAKDKGKSTKRGRGKARKKSSDEESETLDLSEDSADAEALNKKSEDSNKEGQRAGRGRRNRSQTSEKSDDVEIIPSEGKRSSRRGAATTAKKETPAPRKRPTRGVQAKRYAEEDDDDDDIEEIEPKTEEYDKPEEGSRKRKRGSTSEANKKLKETENAEDKEVEEVDDNEGEIKLELDEKDADAKGTAEEPMDIDASNAEEHESKQEVEDKTTIGEKKDESQSSKIESSKNQVEPNKQENTDVSENLDESIHSSDSDQGSRPESSCVEDSQEAESSKEEKTVEQNASQQEDSNTESTKLQDSIQSPGLNKNISDSKSEPLINNEQNMEVDTSKSEAKCSLENDKIEKYQNDKRESESNKAVEVSKDTVISTTSAVSAIATHSSESNHEKSLNSSEKPLSNASNVQNASTDLHSGDNVLKTNGAHEIHDNSVSDSDQYFPISGRKYMVNAKLGESIRASIKDKSFGFVSYNLSGSASEASLQKEKLLNELNKLDSHIICIQQVSQPFYVNVLEPSLDALGFKGTFTLPEDSGKGIATFYKTSLFRLSGKSEVSLKNLIEKDLEASSLESFDRHGVRSLLKNCGQVLVTHFATVIGMHTLTVANVMIPPTDVSLHALQVSCLVREVVRANGGSSRPFLIGGEFNMEESEAPYQLLRDGYLSNDMIEELQRRKDVAVPGKENAALVNLLWKSFQHPSSTLCSCYKSVLDREVAIPEQKGTSPDLLWYSSDSLYTVGVLDASEKIGDHFSLKADIAFSV